MTGQAHTSTTTPPQQMAAWRNIAILAQRSMYATAGLSLHRYCLDNGIGQIYIPAEEGTDLVEAFTTAPQRELVGLEVRGPGGAAFTGDHHSATTFVSAAASLSHLGAVVLDLEEWVRYGDDLFFGGIDRETGDLRIHVNPDADTAEFSRLANDTSVTQRYLDQIDLPDRTDTPTARPALRLV